jgi:hypothetical protein
MDERILHCYVNVCSTLFKGEVFYFLLSITKSEPGPKGGELRQW